MDGADVINQLRERGFLLSPEALKAITDSENPGELARRALDNAAGKILIELSDLVEKEKEKAEAEVKAKAKKSDVNEK
jgi:hypothetical protein